MCIFPQSREELLRLPLSAQIFHPIRCEAGSLPALDGAGGERGLHPVRCPRVNETRYVGTYYFYVQFNVYILLGKSVTPSSRERIIFKKIIFDEKNANEEPQANRPNTY